MDDDSFLRKGTPPQGAMYAGRTIAGRYRLIARAGSGGMGEVWSADDETTGARVALKVMLERSASLERFTREAQVLASLAHPAIVSYVDHGVAEGAAYLAMEWLEGEDLAARLSRGPLSAEESSALAERLAGALGAAHRAGVVHRDLKPSNVFLCEGRADAAKLVDFGIARGEGFSRETKTGVLIGTPGYMAPEQVRGERDVDARVDVFALGCVLFEAASGRPAFSGDSPLAVLAKVLLEDAPPLAAIMPELPARFAATVARMLSKERADRPADGDAVVRELAQGASGAPARPAERSIVTIVGVLPTDLAVAPTMEGAVALSAESSAVHVERLADGTLLYVFSGAEVATDHAARAARRALTVRAERPDAPIAIASGRAVLGAAIGEVVDRVTALLAIEGSAIRVDPLTAGLLDVRFGIGGDEHGLTLGAERSSAQPRLLLGRPAPCVGRDRDLSILHATWEECALDRTARAVTVTAPAGAGKTRLSSELVRSLESGWIRATADPLASSVPFGVLGRAIRSAASIDDADPIEVARQKLAARIGRHAIDDGASVIEVLGEVAQARAAEPSARLRVLTSDPTAFAEAIRAAAIAWLRAESTEPLLVVLDDVHWADDASLRLFESALQKLASRPFMVVALGRPETRPDLFARAGALAMRLAPLGQRACAELVRHALGGVSDDITARIAEQSEGNAFFLEELIRAAASGALPDTVIALGHARLATLEAPARRVVRAASVFGLTFQQDGLRRLAGEDDVDAIVADLVEREIFEPRTGELAFRHALLREAAYGMSAEEETREWHRMAGDWLAERGAPAAMIADHFERASDRPKAAHWYRKAAVDAYRFDDKKALAAAAEAGIACGAEGAERGYLLSLLASARWWAGDARACLRHGREALGAVEPGTSAWFQAIAASFPAIVQIGDVDEATALSDALGRVRPGMENLRRYARATSIVATELGHLALIDTASAFVDRVIATTAIGARAVRALHPSLVGGAEALLADRADEYERVAVELWGSLEALSDWVKTQEGSDRSWGGGLALAEQLAAWRALFTGDPWRARCLALASMRRFEERGMVRDPDWSRFIAALACLQLESDDGVDALVGEHAPRMSSLFAPGALYVRGASALERGDRDAAVALMRAGVEGVRKIGSVPMIGIALSGFARAALAQGDTAAAEACFHEAVPGIERFRLHAKPVWTVGAQIAVALGDHRAARERIDRALTSVTTGSHQGEIELRLDEHDVRRALGDDEGARAAVSAARAELDRIARSIDDPAQAAALLRSRRARRLARLGG